MTTTSRAKSRNGRRLQLLSHKSAMSSSGSTASEDGVAERDPFAHAACVLSFWNASPMLSRGLHVERPGGEP